LGSTIFLAKGVKKYARHQKVIDDSQDEAGGGGNGISVIGHHA